MRAFPTILVWLALLGGFGSSAFAQSVDEPVVPSRALPVSAISVAVPSDISEARAIARTAELARWSRDFTEWKAWMVEWGNRRQRGWLTSAQDRREKPVPPDWLFDECELGTTDTEQMIAACNLLVEWGEFQAAQLRQAQTAAIQRREGEPNTIWWEHLHMDLLWPSVQVQASAYGIVGVHATTTVGKRLQVFIAPGAMLLNLPAKNGSRAWKVATNYGIGFLLFDFSFPGNRRAVLNLNLAKSWLVSDVSDVVAGRSLDFVGFSIAFRKTH